MTTAAFSPPLPARGRESSRPTTLPPIGQGLGVALELHFSQSTVESGGDASKTGRVTGTIVQLLKSCPYISSIVDENDSQPFSGRDSFSTIYGGKLPSNVPFQQLLKSFSK